MSRQQRNSWKSAATLAIATLMATGLAPSGLAFGTIEGLGQSSEHEKITRLGLKEAGLGPDTLTALAGERGAFGAVGAPALKRGGRQRKKISA
jgi:hypothetical protein